MPAESAKATMRDRVALIPSAAAAVSLPCRASRNLPLTPRRTRITTDPGADEHRHAEQEEHVVAREELGSRHLEREEPAADPIERDEDAVEHQREGQRREREIDAAETEHRDRQQAADSRGHHGADGHREQHGEIPSCGRAARW